MAVRQGSLVIVDVERIKSRGALSVAESRILNMRKFIPVVISIAIANPTLYLIAGGIGVGKLINDHSGGVDGVKYLTFLAPALLATAAIQTAMDETVFTTIQGFKWGKVFYAMNATPLTGKQIANGVFISSTSRAAFSVVVYGIIINLFGGFTSPKGWISILIGLLAGAAFGALMLGISAWIRNDDQFFNILGRFIMMPLFLFSATFFPISLYPAWLGAIVAFSPLYQAAALLRGLDFGQFGWIMILRVAYLAVLALIGLRVASRRFARILIP